MRKQKDKNTAREEQCHCKGVGYIIRGDSDNVEEIEVHVCRVCKRYRNAWDALRAHMLRRNMLLVCPRCHGNGYVKDVLRDGYTDSLRITCCTTCDKFKGDFNAMLKAYLGQHELSRTVRKTEERVPLVPTCNENVQVALNNAVLNHGKHEIPAREKTAGFRSFKIDLSLVEYVEKKESVHGDVEDTRVARSRAIDILKEALEIASSNVMGDNDWAFSYRDNPKGIHMALYPTKGGE